MCTVFRLTSQKTHALCMINFFWVFSSNIFFINIIVLVINNWFSLSFKLIKTLHITFFFFFNLYIYIYIYIFIYLFNVNLYIYL